MLHNPNTKTKVVHSESSPSYNVIGISLGKKHMIAKLPYIDGIELDKEEAKQHAEFISYCFNNSDSICNQAKHQ